MLVMHTNLSWEFAVSGACKRVKRKAIIALVIIINARGKN